MITLRATHIVYYKHRLPIVCKNNELSSTVLTTDVCLPTIFLSSFDVIRKNKILIADSFEALTHNMETPTATLELYY